MMIFALTPQSAYAACPRTRPCTPPKSRHTPTSPPSTAAVTPTFTPTLASTSTPVPTLSPTLTLTATLQGAGKLSSSTPTSEGAGQLNQGGGQAIQGGGTPSPFLWLGVLGGIILVVLISVLGRLSVFGSRGKSSETPSVIYPANEVDVFPRGRDESHFDGQIFGDNSPSPDAGGVVGSMISVDGIEHSHETVKYKDPEDTDDSHRHSK